MPIDDRPTPAEQMINDLYLAPGLTSHIEDQPLIAQAIKNVDETVRHAHETAEPPADNEADA